MASRISVVGTFFVEGNYTVKWDHPAERSNQLAVNAGEIVQVVEQNEKKGWVWAQIKRDGSEHEQGYVPGSYLEKVAGGDFDQWAYGAEFVGVLVGFFTGLMIFLYGSALQEDKATLPMSFGCLGMIMSSFLMVLVVLRDRVACQWRAASFFLTSIVLFAGYPTGVWGGIFLLFTTCIELVVFVKKDLTYMPEMWDPSTLCDFWKSSCLAIIAFSGYVVANVFVFILGAEYGSRRVDEWTDLTNVDQRDIGRLEWEFAQGCAVCICFNIVIMIIFALQGFQQLLVAMADRLSSSNTGKMASLRDFLIESLSPTSMIWVHQVFACAIVVFTMLHIVGCFAAYETSGPSRDFDEIFGEAPYITGGVMAVLLAVIIASSWIPMGSRPGLYKNIHRLGFVLFGVCLLHGKDWWAPNFWKWIIGPIILYALDKAFRFGIFGITSDHEQLTEFGDFTPDEQ